MSEEIQWKGSALNFLLRIVGGVLILFAGWNQYLFEQTGNKVSGILRHLIIIGLILFFAPRLFLLILAKILMRTTGEQSADNMKGDI